MMIHDAAGSIVVVSAESVKMAGEGCIVLNARAVYIHNQASWASDRRATNIRSPTAFTLRNAIVCREAVIMISIGVAFPGFPCTTTSSISSESSSTGTYVTLLKSSMMTAFDKGMNLASYAGRFGDVHVMRTQSTCPSTGYRHVTRSSGRCVHSFLRICHMSKANVGTARTLTSVWSASPICSSFLRRVGRFVYLLSASLRRRGKDPKRSTFEDGA